MHQTHSDTHLSHLQHAFECVCVCVCVCVKRNSYSVLVIYTYIEYKLLGTKTIYWNKKKKKRITPTIYVKAAESSSPKYVVCGGRFSNIKTPANKYRCYFTYFAFTFYLAANYWQQVRKLKFFRILHVPSLRPVLCLGQLNPL